MTSKTAEILTKQWLMGVRRGWLSLTNSNPQTWKEIFAAFNKMVNFVVNLKEQVLFVRRGPLIILDTDEAKELEAAFSALLEAVKDLRSSANFWYEAAEGIGLAGMSGRQADGLKMFELYRTKFHDMLTTHVKTRINPAKKQYNPTREANIIELLDRVLELLREEAKRLEKGIKTEQDATGHSELKDQFEEAVFKEFEIGRMRVVITSKKGKASLIQKYVRLFDKAHQLIRAKGFGKLWYGTVFIEDIDYKELSSYEQEQYKRLGYKDLHSTAGTYHSGDDVVRLTLPPVEWTANTIVHELGHRYWYKVMSRTQRARFNDLVQTNKSDVSRDWPSGLTQDGDELPGARMKPVSPVSSYGFSSIEEAFATVFAAYVTNEGSAKMNRDQLESFKSVLASVQERVLLRFLSGKKCSSKPRTSR